MPVQLQALGKKIFKFPPFYLIVFGFLLIVFGACFVIPNLTNLGALFTIIGFFLCLFWNIISEMRSQKKNSD
jgi:uncharacterized membrane protein YphA (DoxX/SURF4 family)